MIHENFLDLDEHSATTHLHKRGIQNSLFFDYDVIAPSLVHIILFDVKYHRHDHRGHEKPLAHEFCKE